LFDWLFGTNATTPERIMIVVALGAATYYAFK